MINLLNKAKVLWSKEQLRVYVMVSLGMQIFLIVFAPCRKRSGNKLLIFSLWAAYLGADYIATMTISSILTYTMDILASTGHILPAFWAPFLLLHLGGPDSITSYSIQDNDLWLRHLLSVAVHVPMAFVVLVQSSLRSTTLLVPNLLIFLAGSIKYGERTLALRGATEKQIKRLGKHRFGDDIRGEFERQKSSEVSGAELIFEGYISFWLLTPFLVHNIVRYEEDLEWGGRDFKVVGITLSFYYDILHTKAKLIHSLWGCGVRLASLVCISIALILFHISKKRGHDSADVIVTYILLLVALILDIYSLLILVTSKWTIGYLMHRGAAWSKRLAEFICRISCSVNKRWWSGRMGQHSLLQSAMKSWGKRIEEGHTMLKPFKRMWGLLFGDEPSFEPVEASEILEDMMMKHVRSVQLEYPDENPRSSWMARTFSEHISYLRESKPHLEGLSFEECVVIWHVVTELCYVTSNGTDDGDTEQGRNNTVNRDIEQGRNNIDNNDSEQIRTAIYRISNYMMYLLVKQSEMLPPGIAELRVSEIVRQIEGIFDIFVGHLPKDRRRGSMHVLKSFAEYFSEELSIRVPIREIFCAILRDLHNIRNSSLQWKVMRDVWMEMLTYAALGCSTREQAKSLSRGGELLTHHWMLSVHYYLAIEPSRY